MQNKTKGAFINLACHCQNILVNCQNRGAEKGWLIETMGKTRCLVFKMCPQVWQNWPSSMEMNIFRSISLSGKQVGSLKYKIIRIIYQIKCISHSRSPKCKVGRFFAHDKGFSYWRSIIFGTMDDEKWAFTAISRSL